MLAFLSTGFLSFPTFTQVSSPLHSTGAALPINCFLRHPHTLTPSNWQCGSIDEAAELGNHPQTANSWLTYSHSTNILIQISQNTERERVELSWVELGWGRSLGLQRNASVVAGPALKFANTVRTLAHPHRAQNHRLRWLPHSREDAHHQPPATSGIDSQRLLEAWISQNLWWGVCLY